MPEPLVTIITPCLNSERYLPEAIESVRSQSLADFEHIIVDDGSRDRTREIIRRAAAEDQRVRPILSGSSQGSAAARECRLHLAGGFSPDTHGDELAALSGWERVMFHGWASRPEVATILGNVRAGLVVLHSTKNYPDAYPVKMFEYMAAGLPVIASDFPLWRQIVDGAGCGLLVDPQDSAAIAQAMEWLLAHPEEAEAMGRRGREAVERLYNWAPEAEKLLMLYRRLLMS